MIAQCILNGAHSQELAGDYLSDGNECPSGAAKEAVVARVDAHAGLTKNDNYMVATNSQGQVFVPGPHKGLFHHVSSGQSVDVNSLFNQNPLFNECRLTNRLCLARANCADPRNFGKGELAQANQRDV